MRNALIALSSIGPGDLPLAFTSQPKGECLYGALGKGSHSCEPATETCLRGRLGLAAEKDKCGPKDGKRRGPPMCRSRYQQLWSECFLSDCKHPVQEGFNLRGFSLSAYFMASSRSHSYYIFFFFFFYLLE